MVRSLSQEDKVQDTQLLEMQRNGMLMYPCGWFFEDISGIESVQVMRVHLFRAMQPSAREVAGADLEPEFIHILKAGKVSEHGNGAQVYKNFVRTSSLIFHGSDFIMPCPHWSEVLLKRHRIRNYTLRNEAFEKAESGDFRLALGKVFLHLDTTWEENILMFAVLHLGNHNFMGGAREYAGEKTYGTMRDELLDVFSTSDIPRMILCLERHYGSHSYTLRHLFRDGQRKVLYAVLDSTLADMESAFSGHMYNQFFPLLSAMREMQIPPPKVLEDPVWYIINLDLKKILSAEDPDIQRLAVLVGEMTRGKFEPDTATLNFTASGTITTLMQRFLENPGDAFLMEKINEVFKILCPLALNYDLWECQNYYFRIGRKKAADMQVLAGIRECRCPAMDPAV